MERDFFKQYIQEHKDAFENEALPPNMLGNILGNLKEHQQAQAQKKHKLIYTWWAVACSLFIVVGAYLFLSQASTEIQKANRQAASKVKVITEKPIVSKIGELPITENFTVKPTRQFAAQQPKTNPHKEIYMGLADSLSVANRLNAIIKTSSFASLNERLKKQLCKTFDKDDNDNVRLAALEVLSKFSNDKYIQEQLMLGLSKQKDPVVQLELIKIMGPNSNPETTDKLIAMANNPFTVEAVKEQVYYALLTNNN